MLSLVGARVFGSLARFPQSTSANLIRLHWARQQKRGDMSESTPAQSAPNAYTIELYTDRDGLWRADIITTHPREAYTLPEQRRTRVPGGFCHYYSAALNAAEHLCELHKLSAVA
jgi:hypothetical protein